MQSIKCTFDLSSCKLKGIYEISMKIRYVDADYNKDELNNSHVPSDLLGIWLLEEEMNTHIWSELFASKCFDFGDS